MGLILIPYTSYSSFSLSFNILNLINRNIWYVKVKYFFSSTINIIEDSNFWCSESLKSWHDFGLECGGFYRRKIAAR